MMAGLALVVLALGSPAFAVCVAPRTFASSGGTAAEAYVYRSDVAAAWGGVYPDVSSGPGPSLSPSVRGSWWSLGSGNPQPLVGVDNGTQGAAGYWLFYGGTSAGGNYYAYYIAGSWSGDVAIDGCIDTTGSNPAAPDPDQCMMLMINDTDGAGNGYFALASDNADGIGNYDFSTTGQIVLQPVPKPRVIGSTRVDASQVNLTVGIDPVPAGPGEGIYTTCGSGPAQFRLYKSNVPRNGPAPDSRDLTDAQTWAFAGEGPVGGSTGISVTCSGDEDIYLAASLVFDSGFELELGSANGTRVQCGPTFVDPVKPITPPRRGKPTDSVGPRDGDRGGRR
jgi:hypothetical protein